MGIVNPIYNNLLGWNLQSTEAELREGPEEVDFSLTERTWVDTAKTVVLFLLKIILFPWAIYEIVRWCIQRLVMMPLFPIQSSILKCCFIPKFRTEALDKERGHFLNPWHWGNSIVRHVALEKEGNRLSGLLIGNLDTINNGKWVLQATPNAASAEEIAYFANSYQHAGYNTLLINPPGVGRSEGFATSETIGQAHRTALAYLETALKANQIVLAGYSLGGASIGKLIEQYDFEKSQANFLVVRQMTFGKVSEMAALRGPQYHVPACIAKALVHWTSCEMDNVKSSKKLAEYNIREVIIQGGRDGVIPESVSLAKSLEQEPQANKEFVFLEEAHHFDTNDVLNATVEQILAWEDELQQPLEVAE